jgi:hypothetical protein
MFLVMLGDTAYCPARSVLTLCDLKKADTAAQDMSLANCYFSNDIRQSLVAAFLTEYYSR